VHWGLKNFEFLMILADDLQSEEVFKILLSPKPVSLIMKDLPFSQAMDSIEDLVINNSLIPDELKIELLNSDEMLCFGFVGAILYCEEEPVDIQVIFDLYDRLHTNDVLTIIKCHHVIQLFAERVEDLHED